MDEQGLLDRIERWQAAGLIDAAAADRLRAAEAARPAETAPPQTAPPRTIAPVPMPAAALPPSTAVAPSSTVAAVFGPGVTVVEMFAYLGTAFLLGAVVAFFARLATGPASGSSADQSQTILGIGAAVEAVALTVIGLVLRTGTPRRRRAAGIAFLAAVVAVGSAISLFGATVGLEGLVQAIVTSGAAVAVALAFRLILPGLTTELALLGSITVLSSSLLVWIESLVAPPPTFLDNGTATSTALDPLVLVLGAAIWWLATAFLLGIFGLLEAYRGRRDPAAQRRAGVVRLWAGLTAVLGLFYAVSQSTNDIVSAPGRALEPVIGDFAVLVMAAILLERAYRRESNAYVFAAAIGCIVALSDLDGSYLAGTPDVALLLEGLILLIVGFGAEYLRRRLNGPAAGTPSGTAPA